jgi:hypothetical protein
MCFIRTSDTGSELPRGATETQQRRHIGSSDPELVLPRPWLKLASEALSVLPTQCKYYRQKQGVEWKESICARVDSILFSLTWVIS